MTETDLPWVAAIAAAMHPALPEDDAVFAERLRLYPQGCHVLLQGGAVTGYVLSHPWRDGKPPAINSLLNTLPAVPTTYYIHDLALLPAAQRSGAGRTIVAALIAHAAQSGLPAVSLVAVNNSERFWQEHGFRAVHTDDIDSKLRSYGAAACFMRLALPPAI